MPESYTDPAEAYATAKRRGMDFVTLTDHNTIAGALEIAHHEDVFISVEVTAELPEDRTPLHVLVWGIGERDWPEMDALRRNVYELIDYVGRAASPTRWRTRSTGSART
jgi:predicted metal-dependent phosphoesterase TrpH